MLIVATNILVRCIRGKAVRRVFGLTARGVVVLTTDANARELSGVLIGKLAMDEAWVGERVRDLLAVVETIGWGRYGHLEAQARERLRGRGEDDWPALAAAIALDAQVWTDDPDFFGVGVPIWSTPNVHLAPSDRQV